MQSKEEKNVRKTKWAKILRDKRKKAGLCTRCGKEPLFSQTRCYKCAVKHREEQRVIDHSDERVKSADSYHPEDKGLSETLNEY